jgi:hypothetical protein
MRRLVGVCCLALVSTLVQAEPADTPISTIHRFIDASSRGDDIAVEALQTPDVSIIDEFPPHAWRPPGAYRAWAADAQRQDMAEDVHDGVLSLGRVVREVSDGRTAYVVVHALYRYKTRGVLTDEPAEMVFALQRGQDGWKITAWCFTGTVPHPSATKSAPH